MPTLSTLKWQFGQINKAPPADNFINVRHFFVR